MNVASISFLAFGLVVALAYNLFRPLWWRQSVLVIANLAFLSTFSRAPRTWIPYGCFLAVSYGCYWLVRNRVPHARLCSVLGILLFFFSLKRYTFLPSSLFLTSVYATIGLSYVLFRLLHLFIDTGDGLIQDPIGPLSFLNYTLNFTAIISGPIQLFPDYARDQLQRSRPSLNSVVLGQAVERLLFGFFKISILGMIFQALQAHALANVPRLHSSPLHLRVLTGVELGLAYPLFLYFNFSGYTDMVIGMAKGIRLDLPENFDRPFSSLNFLEFWSRWHISLSSWLKTYVYGPLLKLLLGRFTQSAWAPYLGVFCFFVTFFLVGLWHGRTSVFVAFGVLQGLGVAVNKLYQIQATTKLGKKGYKKLASMRSYQVVCRGLTFTFFAFSLVWFWSNWQQMAFVLHSLSAGALIISWVFIFFGASLFLWAYESVRAVLLTISWKGATIVTSRYTRVVWGTALAVVMTVLLTVLAVPAPDVVYKGF